MQIKLVGAALITHNGVSIGKTIGGASINILEHSYRTISDSHKEIKKSYGVEGEINLFVIENAITVSNDLTLFDYGQIIFTLEEGTLTLYHTKIFLPNSLSLGTNSQNPLTVRLSGGVDNNGNIYKIN